MFKFKFSTVLQLCAVSAVLAHYGTRKVIAIGMDEALSRETIERIRDEAVEHRKNLLKK